MRERLAHYRASDGYARWERRTDLPLLVLALAFLVVLLLPLLADLSDTGRSALSVVSAVIWAVFAVDYVARLYLTGERWRIAAGASCG